MPAMCISGRFWRTETNTPVFYLIMHLCLIYTSNYGCPQERNHDLSFCVSVAMFFLEEKCPPCIPQRIEFCLFKFSYNVKFLKQ